MTHLTLFPLRRVFEPMTPVFSEFQFVLGTYICKNWSITSCVDHYLLQIRRR